MGEAFVPWVASRDELARTVAVLAFNIARDPRIEPPGAVAAIEHLVYELGGPDPLGVAVAVIDVPTPRRHVPEFVRRRILGRDGFRCLNCGATEDLEVDHVVPRALGGLHAEENFQTLCAPCNGAKGATAVDYRLDSSPA